MTTQRARSDSSGAAQRTAAKPDNNESPATRIAPGASNVGGNIIARTSARAAQRIFNADTISLRAARPLSWKAGLLSDFGAGVTSLAASTEAVRRASQADEPWVTAVLMLCVVLASSLLGVVAVRRFVDLHPGTVRLFSVLAIASFWLPTAAPDWLRVAAVVVGVAADQCVLFANLFERGERRHRALSGLLLAFVSIHFLLIRHDSQLRVFTAPFVNAVTVIFALFSAAWSGIERASSLSLLEQQIAVRPADATWITPSLALGTALFFLNWLAREDLVPTIALLVGVFIAFIRPQFVRSVVWLAFGCVSAALLWWFATTVDDLSASDQPQLALAGIAGLIVFATALLPAMTAEMTRTRLLGRASACTMLVMSCGLRIASETQLAVESRRLLLLGAPMALIVAHYVVTGWNVPVEIAVQAPDKTTFLPRRELIAALVALTLMFAPTVIRLL